jgi:virginiamycin B lyase
VAGADGALWFAEANTNTIARITTAGQITQRFTIPTANAGPVALLVAPRGGLLLAEHAAGALTRMSVDGHFGRELRLRSHPDAITLSPDGDAWYASGDEGKVGRVHRAR